MIPLSKCFRYEPEIKRLTKANSIAVNGRVLYIVKKFYNGDASRLYACYDYKTKIQLAFHEDKDMLIEFMKKQDLKVLDEVDI